MDFLLFAIELDSKTTEMAGVIALVAAISTAIGTILGVWWTKGVDARVKLMRARKESNLDAREFAEKVLHQNVEEIKVMKEHLQECEDQHNKCEQRCARLEGRLGAIEERLKQSGS